MKNIKKIYFILILIGLIDSIYLTYAHYVPNALICSSTGFINCALVTTSKYSVVFGIPLAIYGLIWFIAQLMLFFVPKNNDIKIAWNSIGLFAVSYSVISMYLLGKICKYCTMLDILIVLIFFIYFKAKD